MEFNEKLQELRKQKGLTQEELANKLYVSRTAVSKWESGKGYPSIESLKNLSEIFSVSIDDLISTEKILDFTEKINRERVKNIKNQISSLLDLVISLLFFLPVFADRTDGIIKEVSLFSLTSISSYLKIFYILVVSSTVLWGAISLFFSLQKADFLSRQTSVFSLALSFLTALMFIISLQPYPAIITLSFFLMKVFILAKKQ